MEPEPTEPTAAPGRRLANVLTANKQFVIAVAVVLLAVFVFPGGGNDDNDNAFRTGPKPAGSSTTVVTAPETTEVAVPLADALREVFEAFVPTPPSPPSNDDYTPPSVPPPAPLPPQPVCSTDAAADIVDSVRGPLAGIIGQPIPGKALRDLAAIAAGCSTQDPTIPTLDLAIELVSLAPDLGLPTVPVPQLPGLPAIPVPDEVIDALGPVADPIKAGCENLALIALLLVVLPPAAHLPFKSADLIQFLAPASTLCALFDEPAP